MSYFYSIIIISQQGDLEYIKKSRKPLRYMYGLIDYRYSIIRLSVKTKPYIEWVCPDLNRGFQLPATDPNTGLPLLLVLVLLIEIDFQVSNKRIIKGAAQGVPVT